MTPRSQKAAATEPVIRDIVPSEAVHFSGLTAPALRTVLGEAALPADCWRIGAFLEGEPAGLLLSAPGFETMQDLTTLMVAPGFRRRGIGRALLNTLHQRAQAAGKRGLVARWSNRLPRAQEFQALLASAGWSAPVETRRRMTWRVGDWRKGFPRRDQILARLRAHGLNDRSLAELGPEGLAAFRKENAALIAAGRAPEWASAEGWIEGADSDLSLVLHDRDGALCGWIAVYYQPQWQRWFVPQGWVVREKVPQGWLVGGIASLIARLEEKAGPEGQIIAQPPAGIAGGMEAMLHRHFGPYAVAMDFLNESEFLFRRDGG